MARIVSKDFVPTSEDLIWLYIPTLGVNYVYINDKQNIMWVKYGLNNWIEIELVIVKIC